MKLLVSTLALSCAAFAASAWAEPPARMHDGMLVDGSGMTLYTFDKDAAGSGKSVCNGPCAKLWPPAMASVGTPTEGDFTIVARDDGSHQWAYKGKPLYHYSADKKAGDMTGDKFRDVWHVVR